MNEELIKLKNENLDLMHALQTGVAAEHSRGSQDGSPKHLRVGVNNALVGNWALVSLLIEKGIITEVEYMTRLNEELRNEVQRYETNLSENLGRPIKLI